MLNTNSSSINILIQYLFFSNNSFFRLAVKSIKSSMYLINSTLSYYSSLVLKYSTFFYKPSLIELFNYEIPSFSSPKNYYRGFFFVTKKPSQVSIHIYFLSNYSTYLYMIFFCNSTNLKKNNSSFNNYKFESIENLFFNANWLERESSEMSGLFYSNKLDSRNLLMMYGDVFYPLLKFFTSVGLFELFYNVPNDVIIKANTSLQN